MFAWHRARLRRNTALSRRAVLECGRCEMGYSTRREEPFSIRTCRGCALFHRVNRPGETAGESPHGGRGTASPRGPRPRGGSARAGRGGRRARAFRRWRRRPTARPLRPRAALTGGVPNVSPRNTGAHEARGNGREGGAAASRAPRRPRRSSSTHHCTVSTAADGRVRVADQTGTVLGFPSARLACGPRPGGARSQRATAKEFPPPPPGHPWRPAAGHPPTRWPRAQSRQEIYAATVKRPCPLSRPRAVERTVTARRRDPWHARPLAVREGNCAGRGGGGAPPPRRPSSPRVGQRHPATSTAGVCVLIHKTPTHRRPPRSLLLTHHIQIRSVDGARWGWVGHDAVGTQGGSRGGPSPTDAEPPAGRPTYSLYRPKHAARRSVHAPTASSPVSAGCPRAR